MEINKSIDNYLDYNAILAEEVREKFIPIVNYSNQLCTVDDLALSPDAYRNQVNDARAAANNDRSRRRQYPQL